MCYFIDYFRRGDKMLIKADGDKPKVYCENRGPTQFYPAVAVQKMTVKKIKLLK